MEKQSELARLQGEHHTKVLEAQKLQRALDRKQQELADLQQAKEQLDEELEDLQQQKKNSDKAINVRQPDPPTPTPPQNKPLFFYLYVCLNEQVLSETVYDIIASRI